MKTELFRIGDMKINTQKVLYTVEIMSDKKTWQVIGMGETPTKAMSLAGRKTEHQNKQKRIVKRSTVLINEVLK